MAAGDGGLTHISTGDSWMLDRGDWETDRSGRTESILRLRFNIKLDYFKEISNSIFYNFNKL